MPDNKSERRVNDNYTIVIMDYTSGSLRFYYFNNEPENPEEWIRKHDKAWSDDSCYWMGVNNYGIDEDHFYDADNMKEA